MYTALRFATARTDPKLSSMQSFRGNIAAGGLRSSIIVRRIVELSMSGL
jgi:hypothetical protein